MGLTDMPLFAALKAKMEWHQERQNLLSENVANASTPGYHARDLKPFDFAQMVDNSAVNAVKTATTNPNHISASSFGTTKFTQSSSEEFETTPDGNSVGVEQEMMKVTENQMDYQTATTLYTRSLRLLKTALGTQ